MYCNFIFTFEGNKYWNYLLLYLLTIYLSTSSPPPLSPLYFLYLLSTSSSIFSLAPLYLLTSSSITSPPHLSPLYLLTSSSISSLPPPLPPHLLLYLLSTSSPPPLAPHLLNLLVVCDVFRRCNPPDAYLLDVRDKPPDARRPGVSEGGVRGGGLLGLPSVLLAVRTRARGPGTPRGGSGIENT